MTISMKNYCTCDQALVNIYVSTTTVRIVIKKTEGIILKILNFLLHQITFKKGIVQLYLYALVPFKPGGLETQFHSTYSSESSLLLRSRQFKNT